MFRLGIELSAHEYDYRGNPKPSHESDSSAKRTISFIIAPEVLSIPREQERGGEPPYRSEHAAGRYPAPLGFLATGPKPIDQCNCEANNEQEQRPTGKLEDQFCHTRKTQVIHRKRQKGDGSDGDQYEHHGSQREGQ